MYNDGDKAFGTAADLCVGERMRIALNGIVIASIDVIRRDSDKRYHPKRVEKVSGSPNGLKGRIKVTTRCLWVDRGKLLEALQRAASAALASLRLDSTLGLVEHTVGLALRKVVQKYSNKRPDVIVIATESAPSFTAETKNFSSSQERDISYSSNGTAVFDKNIVHSTKERHVDARLYSKRAQSAAGIDKARVSLADNRETVGRNLPLEVAEVLESAADLVASSSKALPDLVTDISAGPHTVSQENSARTIREKGIEQFVSITDSATTDIAAVGLTQKPEEDVDGNLEVAPIKRRKWKSNEIFSLIEARKQKAIDARQGRKGLWKGVSETLAKEGFDRSPDQCKTVWFTLVKRYKSAVEDVENGVASSEPFLFFDALNRTFSEIEKMETGAQ